MYEYGEPMELFEELLESVVGFNLLSSIWSTLISIATWVLMAVGLYTIAKRRGIHHPWLAWLPFGSSWMLGCISDQYRYVAKGEEKSKRKILLVLDIVMTVTAVATVAMIIVAAICSFGVTYNQQFWSNLSDYEPILSLLIGAVGLSFVLLGVSIAVLVVRTMALYDLFASCTPDNAVIFTVLSVLISGLLQSVLVFASRNKEQGMPPRHQQMYSEQPVWQQPQTPVEPWELNNEE